jgi:multidrug efflux system outer membrane protein
MSRLSSAGLTAGLALTLGACATVGPDYRVPDAAQVRAPAAQQAFRGSASPAVAQIEAPDGWWRLYDDPRLDALIAQALRTNTDLRVAAANLARAEAVVGEADSAREPHAAASAAVERAGMSGEEFLQPVALPAETLGDVGVKVSYQVDLVGRLKRAGEAARADAETSQAALDLARVSVAADVARAYVDVCSAGRQLEVAHKTLDVQTRSQEVTRKLAKAGRGSSLDITRAQAQLDQLRAALPPLEAQRSAGLYRLAVLTGRPPSQPPEELAACVAVPRLASPLPVGDGAALLKRRPDVRQAERALAGATARIGVATAALYPNISLGLSTGSTGLLADLGQPQTNKWAIGGLISWTLPGGGERARIRQADAAADAALARFDGTVLSALRETETALAVYAHELDRNAELRAARDQAAVAQAQAERLYKAGRSPFLSGLDARRTLTQAEAALAASDGQVAIDQVNLFLALGGGWRNAPGVDEVAAAR